MRNMMFNKAALAYDVNTTKEVNCLCKIITYDGDAV